MNLFVSLIRTYVPIAVGAFLTYLAINFNVVVDAGTSLGLTTAFTGLVMAVYYTLARFLESRWPWFGVLLGSTRQPAYKSELEQPQR